MSQTRMRDQNESSNNSKRDSTTGSQSSKGSKHRKEDKHKCVDGPYFCPPSLYGGLRKVMICIPTQVVCPYCGNYVVTVATPVPGLLSWVLCSGIIVLACFLGCCFLPCCKSSPVEVSHSCPVCDKEIFRCQ
ncbi:lITAF domain-containing protein [Dipodomys spectabilis]|uniref:lITAF domain-containing protein n=1 Tax=Dipodomys spectabilis TaxID=105255 RepID=UPI001C540488|nr:lITAF domain-containing protein [Dipodomys spectabilis]